MEDLQIEYIDIDKIKPYEGNAKEHPREQIEQIKSSIENFDMIDPIGIWQNEIVEGHGRYLACKELGYDKVPIIRLDHLTDDERKAYTLIHNQLTLNTGYNLDTLKKELDKLKTFKMADFGFNTELKIDTPTMTPNDEPKANERERTLKEYNLDLFNPYSCEGKYDMPIIENDNYIPKDLIGFNYALSSLNTNVGIHFYLDDYQFERLWNNPEDYIELLSEFDCILSPDFSLYMEMPKAMKIWNVYRSRLIGQYYQQQGIKVIPTISWAEKETYDFCFDGIPKGSIVSVSTIGVKRDGELFEIWKNGMDKMIEVIEPKAILVYGGKLDYDFKNIRVIYYDNKVTSKFKNREEE